MKAFQGCVWHGKARDPKEGKLRRAIGQLGMQGGGWPVSGVYSSVDSRKPLEALDQEGDVIGNRVYRYHVLCLCG